MPIEIKNLEEVKAAQQGHDLAEARMRNLKVQLRAAEKKAAEDAFSGTDDDLIVQAKDPLMTLRLTGATVPQPLRKGKLKKLTREELIEQAKLLQKEHRCWLHPRIAEQSHGVWSENGCAGGRVDQQSGWHSGHRP